MQSRNERSLGRPRTVGTYLYANCEKPCGDRKSHTNIQYGTHFFCNNDCKLNWIYTQFKATKLRGILNFATELVEQ